MKGKGKGKGGAAKLSVGLYQSQRWTNLKQHSLVCVCDRWVWGRPSRQLQLPQQCVPVGLSWCFAHHLSVTHGRKR